MDEKTTYKGKNGPVKDRKTANRDAQRRYRERQKQSLQDSENALRNLERDMHRAEGRREAVKNDVQRLTGQLSGYEAAMQRLRAAVARNDVANVQNLVLFGPIPFPQNTMAGGSDWWGRMAQPQSSDSFPSTQSMQAAYSPDMLGHPIASLPQPMLPWQASQTGTFGEQEMPPSSNLLNSALACGLYTQSGVLRDRMTEVF